MTLEDFFTLTEMKDGLTAPLRVEELLTVMKKEKDSVVKNVSDATRQWTAVASTIAATENKGCLDLFIQLDGLWFLGRWLKDAQEFGNDSSDSFVEESITALLRALEKVHRNNERSISSEIWITVKNLLGHNSSRVQDKARSLFDTWKQGRAADDVRGVVDSDGHEYGIPDCATVTGENSGAKCSAKNGPVSGGNTHEENGADAKKNENLPSSLDGVQPEGDKDLHIGTTNNELEPQISLDHSDMVNGSPSHKALSIVSNPVQENLSTTEELPAKTVEDTASHEACSLPDSKQENIEVSDAQKLNGLSNDEKLFDMTVSISTTMDHALVSSNAGVGSALEATTQLNSHNNFEANKNHILNFVDHADERTPVSGPKKAMGDVAAVNHSGNGSQLFKIAGRGSESHLSVLQSSSDNELEYKKPRNLETTFSRKENIGKADENKENCGLEDLRGGSRFTRSPDVIDTAMSDIELEYGIVDALEVARKVAQEVEQEVVDERDSSCNSTERISDVCTRQPSTLGSVNGKLDLPTEVLPKEVSTGPTQSAGAYTQGEELIINSDNNSDNKPENDLHDLESSLVTMAQEPEPNTKKSLFDFDLNQEVCSDNMERVVNSISTPISVVSASRLAAAPGLPSAPLPFEGCLGWKGSAAISAFRPASPCRNSDGDKTLSVGGRSSGSKHRLECLDFDLNVAEAGDEKGAELMSGKQVTASSGLRSAESSMEASPRKSLKLDLNRISDDGDAPALDSRVEEHLFYDRNGHCSPSTASSSSSMQPSLRNIDLNDRPFSHNNALEQGPYPGRSFQNATANGGPKSHDPVISIMGTRVDVNRKDFVSQVVSLPSGKALEPATDGSITRTAGFMGLVPSVSYTHSPALSYNGLAMVPTTSYSSPVYGASGSIPYIVNSGAPVVPQIMGSTSVVLPPYSQARFIMSMSNATVGLNGSGPPRPNFDLNSGLAIEGGNRDSMGLRQPFMPGQVSSIDELLRANTQASSSSGVVAKRKEPDGGWDLYTYNCRQQQFPWK